MKEDIKEKIVNIIRAEGCFFIDLKTRRATKNFFIEVLADSEKGITVGECSTISKKLSKMFDEEKLFNDYMLDVSSPGIGYPLKEAWQFRKNIGRNVEIQYNNSGEKTKIDGTLNNADDNLIFLADDSQNIIEIRRSEIILAKVKI